MTKVSLLFRKVEFESYTDEQRGYDFRDNEKARLIWILVLLKLWLPEKNANNHVC